ncbi:MAG: lyase family protein, partial [Firmicutes bacterium]|nr:lyase family protein [Bacillota bacterium]
NVIEKLSNFAEKHKNAPTLGYTHLQPAQLTTIGKRATLWINDLVMDFQNLNYIISNIKLRGIKGTVGTQASFLQLFDNDAKKVKSFEKRVLEKLGYEHAYEVTGQTYPRKFDYNILSLLSQIASSCYKFSNDLRILQGLKEIEEPFEDFQIGSSVMAYKRNPMRSERMGALCKFVISLPFNAALTASTQWFERTLDDSANKRIVIAQAFLAIDAVLNLYLNISENLVVYEKIIYKHIMEELPFMTTEAILVECVKIGGNRQEIHEKIRVHSMEAAKNVKEGLENNFIELIKNDPDFKEISENIKKIVDPKNFIGLAPMQVDEFITYVVKPILNANGHLLGLKGDVIV